VSSAGQRKTIANLCAACRSQMEAQETGSIR
jgi:hypothetical protein